MANSEKIRILIADDHPLLRTAIRSLIEEEQSMKVIAETGNGLAAVEMYRAHQPDVALMDLKMPVMNGLEASKKILEDFPNAKIIILTNSEVDADVQAGLKIGALGYILKDTSFPLLLDAIKQVFRGNTFVSNKLNKRLAQYSGYPGLSQRELDVLRMVKEGKNNRAIGLKLGITESTVKSHLKNLMTKLGANDRTQAVVIALQRGIIRQNDE